MALWKTRTRRVTLIAMCVAFLIFGIYLFSLFRQLEAAFNQKESFVPTRIYSDVSHIAPPMLRSQIEARLKSLGYSLQPKTSKADSQNITIRLHTIDYPAYLIPENHPTLSLQGQQVSFNFDGRGADAVLDSIQHNGKEIPDLYLEPEIVATLSRSTSGEVTAGGSDKIRNMVPFRNIPAPVWKAIISIEDQHFLDHFGFDPRGVLRAFWVNLRTFSFAQGGSTITQQLVKNLTARRGKNLFKKVNEIFLSLILEMRFDKETILERYLNEVYLGQIGNLEVHGVAEGAEFFFGKKLEDLNLGEIALMAGLIRGPGYYSPYRYLDRAISRQHLVLQKMVETGQLAPKEAENAKKLPIQLAPPSTTANKAPYFNDFVKAELVRKLQDLYSESELSDAGLRVYSTLDIEANRIAQEAVRDGILQLEKDQKLKTDDILEGALAAVDHQTGFIRALVGGKNYRRSTFNRILNMKRQVGSTFKPLVYLTAFEKGADAKGVPFGPGYPMKDRPWKLTYDHGRQVWEPANYENEYREWVSLRVALAHSLNVVAAKLGIQVGIEKIIETAKAMGVETPLPAVPSLSLGVAELSPVEVVRIYSTLANHGMRDDLTVIRGITHNDGRGIARFLFQPTQAYDPAAVDLLNDVLQDVFTDGTASRASALGFDRPAAGKTGTTSEYRDAWFAGFTPQLTAVVWVGIDKGSQEEGKGKAKLKLTGAGSALPIWVRFMKGTLAGVSPTPFPVSEHLTSVRIDQHTGHKASSVCPDGQVLVEKYISGREPSLESCDLSWPHEEDELVIEN